MTAQSADPEVERRFKFGKNWRAFLSHLDEDRILQAEKSLQDLLGVQSLAGKKFADVGSGSGLFSLAARRLQATVHSFDYDQDSVDCTRELKSRYFADDAEWVVEQGSVLDEDYLKGLGRFDVVYSWGVLHHTGDMWKAIGNAAQLVGPRGSLAIAIYNDQNEISALWKKVKGIYCANALGKLLICGTFLPCFFLAYCAASIVKRKNLFSEYRKRRGMSVLYDWLDWLGGFPFEVAKPEEVFKSVEAMGFTLENLTTRNGLANNQFVFAKLEDL